MKANEIIVGLSELIKKHGDREVQFYDNDSKGIKDIEVVMFVPNENFLLSQDIDLDVNYLNKQAWNRN